MSLKLVQLDLFRSEKEAKENFENEEFKTMCRKSIRSLFARYNEMEAILLDMHKTMDRLKDEVFKDG